MKRLLLLALLVGCGGGPDVETRAAAYTTQCYGSTCFWRPNTSPPGTDCPIRWYGGGQMIGNIYLQDWCQPGDYGLYYKAQLCAWNRNDGNPGGPGFAAINNSWCGELTQYTGIPDLAVDQYQHPTGNWPWQVSSLLIGSHIQVALCTQADYAGNCYFFGRGVTGARGGNYFPDVRAYTTDSSTGLPWPHMSIYVQ
jgi:hypothetical protein